MYVYIWKVNVFMGCGISTDSVYFRSMQYLEGSAGT